MPRGKYSYVIHLPPAFISPCLACVCSIISQWYTCIFASFCAFVWCSAPWRQRSFSLPSSFSFPLTMPSFPLLIPPHLSIFTSFQICGMSLNLPWGERTLTWPFFSLGLPSTFIMNEYFTGWSFFSSPLQLFCRKVGRRRLTHQTSIGQVMLLFHCLHAQNRSRNQL